MSRVEATAAIVVVFSPQADPGSLLAQIEDCIDHLVVVDNSPQGHHPAVARLRGRPRCSVLSNQNQGGLAGAYNRAVAHLLLIHAGLQRIVLLDEDSDVSVLATMLADTAVQALLRADTTAAVAPAYRDRATGLRGKYIQLQRWQLRYLPREFSTLEPVSFVINSMSVWRVPALRAIGPFDEGLRIDHVDTDYCLRARSQGLQLFVAGRHEFAHAIGERKRFTMFGREMQAGGHPPHRRYLIGRNTAWLMCRWLWREPAFGFLCFTRLGYEAAGILLAESNRGTKLLALLRGAVVGLFSRRLS